MSVDDGRSGQTLVTGLLKFIFEKNYETHKACKYAVYTKKRNTCFRIPNCLFYPDNGTWCSHYPDKIRFISPSRELYLILALSVPFARMRFPLVYARTFPALLEFPSLLIVFLNRSEDHQVGHFPFPCTLSFFVFLFFLALFLSSPRQSPARLSVKLCMAAARFSTTRVRIARRRVEARSF